MFIRGEYFHYGSAYLHCIVNFHVLYIDTLLCILLSNRMGSLLGMIIATIVHNTIAI